MIISFVNPKNLLWNLNTQLWDAEIFIVKLQAPKPALPSFSDWNG